jgi:hypothetical protein
MSEYSNYGSEFSRSVIEDLERGGAFTVGIVSDRKHRGTAINVDVMDEDEDEHLFVLQVRQCNFHPRRYNQVRKNYFLAGRNENGNAFAHSIAVNSKSARVQTALCRIWNCTPSVLPHVIRQGDVAVIPDGSVNFTDCQRLDPQSFIATGETSSHVFTPGALYERHDKFFVAESIQIWHTKQQHPFVSAKLNPAKLYRVQVGVRADIWRFSQDTAD